MIKMLLLLVLLVFIILLVAVYLLVDCDFLLFLYSKWGVTQSLSSLTGKVVWITGASSGIGEELAYQLAAKGAKLILSARREGELQRVLEKCQTLSPVDNKISHMILLVDLMQYDEHESCVKKVIQQYGKVDYLVNNAGQSQIGVAMETKLEVCRYLLNLNTLGTISLTGALLPYMVKEKDGCIVVISSIAGKLGSPCSAPYSASKHALQGYFDALRLEVYSSNIKIVSVCPGHVDTGPARRNIGSTLDKKDEVTPRKGENSRMSVIRCCHLIAVAMSTKLEEVWIANQPVLLFTYISQYAPLLAKKFGKYIGRRRFEDIKASLKKA